MKWFRAALDKSRDIVQSDVVNHSIEADEDLSYVQGAI